jgi:hypothetical protein
MLLLIDIFSINRSRGYENPSLDIIVIELCSTGGFPLEEAHEHCSQNQSVISVVILISFQCYCGDCSGYIVVILPFLAFYLCSAYFLYLVYYTHYYIWADYSTKIFHASTSFIIFLKRAGFSWILPRKFIAISTKILI